MSTESITLARSILTSSIWSESAELRIFWITLLLMADDDGVVHQSIPYIARQAGVTTASALESLEKLTAPDGFSRVRENDGRRVTRVEQDGILKLKILNFRRYQSDDIDLLGKAGPTATGLLRAKAVRILSKLAEVSGVSYRAVDSNITPIMQRLREPEVTEEGVMQMVQRQADRWVGTDMETYLRPSTLFNRQKFAQYYDARNLPVAPRSIPAADLAQLENRIAAHPGNPSSTSYHPDLVTQDQINEFTQLKAHFDKVTKGVSRG